LLGTIELKDGQSLATSGDYERGKHIIDPRTGRPANLCQSVTVIGKNAAETDALSTAIFVLGPEEGMKLVRKLDVKAVIVSKNGIIYDNFGFKLR
ncbi:MAG: FAD:protein FMN transferase, partial [Candidatus Margulisiibacteriota bacterium]